MTEEKKNDILEECIIQDGKIYVELSMLENFAEGIVGQFRAGAFLASSVQAMCDEMYIKAGLREDEETTEDGKDNGNSNNA